MVLTALALLTPLAYSTLSNALPFDSKPSRHVRRQSGGFNWNSLACYTDNVAARTFTGAQLVSDSMTTSMCQAFCYSKGFKYAGTEWSTECYCDNEFRNNGVQADSGCDMECSGASGETCGGGVRLSVYENTGTLSPPVRTYPGWTSKGCYTDSVANRALSTQVYVEGGMTIEKCTTKCQSLGFPLAGVEFANECFCAATIGSSGTPTTTGCDMACAGSPDETCGGADRLNIYEHAASPLPSTGDWVLEGATGCHADAVSNRALGLRVYVEGAMTVPKCTEKCFSLNYGYAGVEFADECYCSNSIGSSGVPATDGCTMPCSGDATTVCGGADRITVYKYQGNVLTAQPTVLESYNNFVSQGCYVDSVHARLMTPVDVVGQMTVEKCIDTCSNAEYDVAGVEFGSECYCSVALPVESNKATDNCNMGCAGDAAHLCGGANRLNVYHYQSPSTVTTSTQTETSTETSSTSTSTSTPVSYYPWTSIGCMLWSHRDPPGWSLEDGFPHVSQRELGGRDCLDYCESRSYKTALISGGTCDCVHSPPPFTSISDGDCPVTCFDNPQQVCGGGGQDGVTSVSVYTRTYEVACSKRDPLSCGI